MKKNQKTPYSNKDVLLNIIFHFYNFEFYQSVGNCLKRGCPGLVCESIIEYLKIYNLLMHRDFSNTVPNFKMSRQRSQHMTIAFISYNPAAEG